MHPNYILITEYAHSFFLNAILITDIPIIIANQTVVNVQIGINAEMMVNIVTAVPPLKAVIWSRNDQTLFGSRYTDGNIKTPSLSINNITASDDGTYRCFVYNEVGSSYVDIFLFTWSKYLYFHIYTFMRLIGQNVGNEKKEDSKKAKTNWTFICHI